MDALTKTAIQATLHCLLGCGIGEVLGMVIGNALNLHGLITVVLSIGLAFIFGYAFSIWPLVHSGMAVPQALRIGLAADTVSISTMEIMDNLIMVIIPGAMAASLTSGLFWGSLLTSLLVAFFVTVPVNRYLIARGKGHALVHDHHHHH